MSCRGRSDDFASSRVGQTRNVRFVKPVIVGSFEERVISMHSKEKLSLFETKTSRKSIILLNTKSTQNTFFTNKELWLHDAHNYMYAIQSAQDILHAPLNDAILILCLFVCWVIYPD